MDGSTEFIARTIGEAPPGSKWAVGTEMNETSVPIELKGALANADPASVVSVASDNPRDKLYVRAYDPERILLTVGGFVPAEKGPVIEQWALTTELGQTTASVKPKLELSSLKTSSVLAVLSTNPADKPVAESYDPATHLLTVGGLSASERSRKITVTYTALRMTERIVTINYRTWALFLVEYDDTPTGLSGFRTAPPEAAQWVVIDTPRILMKPKETRKVGVTLSIPADAGVPQKWAVKVRVSEWSKLKVQTANVATALVWTK